MVDLRRLLHEVYGKQDTINKMRRSDEKLDHINKVYIWKQSDKFVEKWLPEHNYQIQSSQIHKDCIGYRCNRNGEAYTIFVYAFGEEKACRLDGDCCLHLTKLPFAKDSIVLVLCLHVDVRITEHDRKLRYEVQNYCNRAGSYEFWRVTTVQGRNILQFFPGKEILDAINRLVSAYNNKSLDQFQALFSDDTYIEHFDGSLALNYGVYDNISCLLGKYEQMKLGYIRFNDVVFSMVPHLENFGYFSISLGTTDDKIDIIKEHSFNEKYEEFWSPDISVDDSPALLVPPISSIEPLAPEVSQRFSVKLYFADGQVGKYTLPINREHKFDQVVMYKGYSFTDKIWRNACLVTSRQMCFNFCGKHFRKCGPGIDFINGFSIGAILLYQNSAPFIEPQILNELAFENQNIKIIKTAFWKQCRLRWINSGAELGAKLTYLSAFMGHKGINETLYYVHFLPEHLVKSSGVDWSEFNEIVPEVVQW